MKEVLDHNAAVIERLRGAQVNSTANAICNAGTIAFNEKGYPSPSDIVGQVGRGRLVHAGQCLAVAIDSLADVILARAIAEAEKRAAATKEHFQEQARALLAS